MITLLKSGEALIDGGLIAKAMAVYNAGSAIYSLYKNVSKMKAAITAMVNGGLGLQQCDDLIATVSAHNKQQEAQAMIQLGQQGQTL